MNDIVSTLEYFPNNGGKISLKKFEYKCKKTCFEYDFCKKNKEREKSISAYLMDGKNKTIDPRNCYIASAEVLSEEIKKVEEYNIIEDKINSLKITKYTTIPSSNGNIHEFILKTMSLLFPYLEHVELIQKKKSEELKSKTSKEREKHLKKLIEANEIIFLDIKENIILVDDIKTTGNSLDLMAKELQLKSNVEVVKYAIARTINE